MTVLGEFLRAAGHKRRVPAEWDCAAFPAAWAIERGFADPMAAWRGAYDTEEGAHALIDRAGGLDVLFAAGMDDAGVPEVETGAGFEPGDIGVVRLLGEQAGAIYTGVRWAFIAERGVSFATLDAGCVIRAWRAGNG